MTAITAANIPSSASSSLEKLACWALLALARVNPDLDILESSGSTTRAVQVSLMIDDTGKPRLVGRISLELSPDYATDSTSKLWAKTVDFSQAALPSGFTSN